MKKFKFYIIMAMAVLSCSVLTSCDEDIDEAMVLSGEWYGDFGMNYTDRYGRTYECYDTNLRFYQRGPYSSHGYGQQVDFYYDEDPYRWGRHDHRYMYMKQYYRFEWSINNGVIHLRYPGNPQLDVDIYDYHLSDRYFDGRIGSSRIEFRLDKLTGFVWSEYDRYGDFYEWDYWDYYAKKNNIIDVDGEEKTSVIIKEPEKSEAKTWRRFK